MMNKSVSASDGFTLLEVLVSLFILAIVLVAVFKLHIQSLSMDNTARFYITAPLLAREKLAVFTAKPLDELAAVSGDFGEALPGYTWRILIDDVESESLGSVARRLKKLTVIVVFGPDHYRYETAVFHFFNAVK
jgi:general secretion pathway protein I